ncbi:MAG: Na(+)/H(+) antiporter subunit D, partial [Deltaproteobacteria bacterium]|nr:Na(+)/H(+) antiporter subunit D [Deltaproteobacteria bacterium]
MIKAIPPALIFILGAMLIPFLRGKVKQIYMLMIPVVAFLDILYLTPGTSWVYNFLGYDLIFCKVDKLS